MAMYLIVKERLHALLADSARANICYCWTDFNKNYWPPWEKVRRRRGHCESASLEE
jgi:hypothetical protein